MVTRVAVMRDSAIASQIGMFGGIQSVAPSLGVELRPIDIRDAGEMERAVVAFDGEPNVGLIKPDIMRKWLDRGEIRSLLRPERQIWRDAICAGNESALQRIRDNSDNGIAVLSRRRVVPAANRAMQKATPSAEDLGEC